MSNTDVAAIRPTIQAIIHNFGGKTSNLVQILSEIQQKYSCISEAAVNCLASELNLSPAHICSVRDFYSFFHATPRGQYHILFSDNIIEHLQGKQALMDLLMQKLGVKLGVPRADGRVTIDNTPCIGMSDQGPAALVNGYPVTRLTKARIEKIAELIEHQVPLTYWPKEFFEVAKNIQRKHILLGETFEPGSALQIMLARGAEATLANYGQSGLRGCGGAGFKVDSKWMICRNTPADERYVVCNADEGEPGTFKDRLLLQSYPDLVIEGMTVCARIVGARKGFIYLRGEYRYLLEQLKATLVRRREQGLLGRNILGTPDFSFDIEIHLGAGAYICGAETALLESLEGRRGVPRKRPPPFPVTNGYMNKPTIVNNVETFAIAAKVLAYGPERFSSLGTAQSKGTKLISVSGDCDRPGIYEFPFGITVREVLDACGARDTQAVQNSGPAGQCLSSADFDRQLCFEDANTTGSFMIFNKTRNMLEVVRNFARFFAHESCGFCTPCRVGTSLMVKLVDKVYNGRGSALDLKEMASVSQVIKSTSRCGLGMTATNPITDTLRKFPQVYEKCLKNTNLTPTFDLDSALDTSRQLTSRTDKAAHL